MLKKIQLLVLAAGFLHLFVAVDALPIRGSRNTWQIERFREADVLKILPASYVCNDVSRTVQEDGLCKCSSDAPSFMVFPNGTHGCHLSKNICQGGKLLFHVLIEG